VIFGLPASNRASLKNPIPMTNWIEDALGRQKADAAERLAALSARNTANAALYAEGLIVFNALFDAVSADVRLYNGTIENPQMKLSLPERIGEYRFQVKRGYTPSFTLTVDFARSPVVVEYSIIRPSAIDQKPYRESGRLPFFLQKDAGAALMQNGRPVSVDEASQVLLLPAIEGFCQPVQ